MSDRTQKAKWQRAPEGVRIEDAGASVRLFEGAELLGVWPERERAEASGAGRRIFEGCAETRRQLRARMKGEAD
jgi:hypothetical protein